MAFYQFGNSSNGSPLGQILRQGLNSLRDARQKLGQVNSDMTQMTDQQIVESFGVLPVKDSDGNTTTDAVTQAGALKAELASDVAAMEAASAAMNQLLAQTG